MRIVADLHIHSKYARACSPSSNLEGLSAGAKIKGIDVLGTGDFTHPLWLAELKTGLKPSEQHEGLYEYNNLLWMLSTELSLIYEQNGKTRKMHHIVFAPNLEIAEQIREMANKFGKLGEDGRPMLSLSSAGLITELESISKKIEVIPAHAWTPWFAIFGSKSGVNSVEEAFEDKAHRIFALETGLSSDPLMNWMISSLDKYTLISNSDAHSPEKLGREANVFELEKEKISFSGIIEAIKTRKGFEKTYEFYPEEGKYHYDGHRNCNVILPPWESEKLGNKCPVCRKPLTVGVMHRINDLADRKYGFKPEKAVPFQHIVPLKLLISKAVGKGEPSIPVREAHSKFIRKFGTEFSVFEAEDSALLELDPQLGSAIIKAKTGKINWTPGYDGEFGTFEFGDGSGKGAGSKGGEDGGFSASHKPQRKIFDF
ncbi:MAG: endonuclease Q family protein [Candidatus Bilamarchaeaceae archaeon]